MTKLVEAKPCVENDSNKEYKQQREDSIRKLAEEEKRLVKGRFRNYETPGGAATVYVKKYHEKYMPPFDKTMMDNEMYEIPLYAARFLNGVDVTAKEVGGKINTCAHLVHGFKEVNGDLKRSEGDGIPVPIITGKYCRRYGFESLEFDV
jgi:hypothetical protein